MTIEYFTRNQYGTMYRFLLNRKQAQLWYNMTGRKTLSESDLISLTELTGAKLVRVLEPEIAQGIQL